MRSAEDSVRQALDRIDTITFDCYGTLIDWRAGIASALCEIFGAELVERTPELLKAYEGTEARIEAGDYQTYRCVLAATVEALASQSGLPLPPGRAEWLAESLPRWRPFADTNGALVRLKRRFRLGVLSNIDRNLFAGTAAHFDVSFDFVITAEDVRSYKPAPGHFERLFRDHARRDRVLHVAQSLYHDGAAADKLDLPFVWINRYGNANNIGVRPLAEYPDLKALADAAGV